MMLAVLLASLDRLSVSPNSLFEKMIADSSELDAVEKVKCSYGFGTKVKLSN